MKKNKGSTLVEYVIPTALVGIVIGVSLYNLFTNNSLLNYIMSSGNMKLDGDALVMKSVNSDGTAAVNTQTNSDTTQTNSDTTQTTSGTSSSSSTSASCSNNSCSINLGDVSLTGVPQNLATYVETTGSSAGTQKMMQLFEQIATQLETKGDVEGSKLYRDLANLGYFNSTIQSKAESIAKSNGCISMDTSCFVMQIQSKASFTLPDNISGILTNFNPSSSSIRSFSNSSTNLGLAKYTEINNASNFDTLKTQYPAYAMVDIYNQIMNNPNFSDSLKSVTKELYSNISEIGYQRIFAIDDVVLCDPMASGYAVKYDPFTGTRTSSGMATLQGVMSLSQITKPKTSTNTNLSSTLVCVSGGNTSDGSACQ